VYDQCFIYSPTDALVSCLKNIFKIYVKTAPTYFGVVTPSSGSALIGTIINALPDDGVTATKHVGAFLM
jgi:hypothetical protein